ncbi:MAG: hypothetical protein ACT4PM_04885 [Gemmatimonadales bacterium]
MTSPRARAEPAPLEELERLLGALEEELLGLRARVPAAPGKLPDQVKQRIGLLEAENQLLRQRIVAAREQVERLRTRMRFMEDRGE